MMKKSNLKFAKTIEYLKFLKLSNEKYIRTKDGKYILKNSADAKKQNADTIREIEEAIAILQTHKK